MKHPWMEEWDLVALYRIWTTSLNIFFSDTEHYADKLSFDIKHAFTKIVKFMALGPGFLCEGGTFWIMLWI